jgi:hypothetical protein
MKTATSKNDTGRGTTNDGAWCRAGFAGELCTVVAQMGAKTCIFVTNRIHNQGNNVTLMALCQF